MIQESSNQSVQANKSYLFLFKLIKFNQRIFFVIVLILFISMNSFSQDIERTNDTAENHKASVVKLDDYLKSIVVSSNTSTDKNSHDNLLSLIKDLKPTIYLKNGLVKIYGENPTCLRSDVASLKIASTIKSSIEDVEIIIINVDNPKEFEVPIDLSVVSNFNKVRYVYFLLSFETTITTLSDWIKNVNPERTVLFTITNRS